MLICLAGALSLAGLLGLAACGGSDREPDAPEDRPTLTGTASGLEAAAQVGVSVRGSQGPVVIARADARGRYLARLDRTPGPYLLRSVDGPRWAAVVLRIGQANLNPLTTLVAADLLGEDPVALFDAVVSGDAELPALSTQAIEASEQRIVERLQRDFGLTVPASRRPVVTVPYDALPGDPMHDWLGAFESTLQAQGLDLQALVDQVASETLRCRAARLRIEPAGRTGAASELCPAQRATEAAPEDATTLRYGFIAANGDRLDVQADGSGVLAVDLLRADGASWRCEAAGCSGVTLGAADDPAGREIVFEGTVLAGAADAVLLSGRLRSGQGEVPLPCAGRGWQVTGADGTVAVDCVAARDARRLFARSAFAFTGRRDPARQLELRLQGDRVVWASLGAPGVGGIEYRCKNDDCGGATVGPAAANGQRRIDIAGMVLQRASNDGSVQADDRVSLDATLVAPTLPAAAGFCPTASVFGYANSDGSQGDLCIDAPGPVEAVEFDENLALSFLQISKPDARNTGILILAVDLLDGQRSEIVWMTPDQSTPLYRCSGTGCIGATVTQRDDRRLLLQLQGTVLQEVDPDLGVGDRSLTLEGYLLTEPVR